WSTVHVLVVSCSVVAVCVMTYSDVPSGIGSQAGETVSVSVVLDTTVRVWPAPVPALITTGRPAHWFAVHALVLSASAVLDAVMMYLDVPSGVVIHAGDTVSVFVVLEDTVRVWPAPVPAVILTTSPAHWLAVHALGPVLVVAWVVVLVCLMAYCDVASGVGVHAGGAVSVFLVLEDTVLVWPTPVPAVIVTGRPVHMLICHDLVVSWSVVLVCRMTYLDVPSGVVVQAGETVSVFLVLDYTVRVWPSPVPAVMLSGRPAHRLVDHDLVVSWSVVLVCRMTYLDVASGVVRSEEH